MPAKSTILALGAAVLLASCGGEKATPPAETSATPTAETPPGLTLSDARIQLPVVSGRPGAAYFTLSQASGPARRITAVAVEMAGRTELHESMKDGAMTAMKPLDGVDLKSGETIKFEPGGKHVMLFDLDPKLRFAKTAKLTVNFADKATATAEAPVTTVADATETMH